MNEDECECGVRLASGHGTRLKTSRVIIEGNGSEVYYLKISDCCVQLIVDNVGDEGGMVDGQTRHGRGEGFPRYQ